jgi:hypothetical protein
MPMPQHFLRILKKVIIAYAREAQGSTKNLMEADKNG